MIQELFHSIDQKDASQFVDFLHPQALFRFAAQPALQGTEAIRAGVQGFLDSIQSLCHVVEEIWGAEQGVVCHGRVCYTRHDGSQLSVPFCNLMKVQDGLITEYLIFADISAL